MTREALEKRFDFEKRKNWVVDFFGFPMEDFEHMLRTRPESFWQDLGARRALRLFHAAAERVPAYKDFLKRHRVRAATVRTPRDFAEVPATTNENYVTRYRLEDRMWDGDVANNKLIAASSGTTGEPKYWPRGGFQEFEAAVIHELLYRAFFEAHKKSTLFLIGFPMGVYVSGVATLLPSWLAAQKFPGASVMSVGNNKAEMLRTLRNLPANYDQTVLIGHPFFVKDVIETGKKEGVPWKKVSVKLMFCSEGVSEPWREYVIRELGGDARDLTSVISTYGSSEFLLMGWETPLSIALRKISADAASAPNVFQYNPLHRFIETMGRDLVFTAASGAPLIRYNLKDAGEVIGFEEAVGRAGSERKTLLRLAGPAASWWRLPFVTLYGRSDHTIIFYAANIYPEHVKAGLNTPAFFRELTGKFTMRKDYLKNMDEFLEINVELRPNAKARSALAARIRDSVVDHLERTNMEYKFLRGHLDKNIVPRIKLWPYGHAKYFKPGLKPRYIANA